MAGGDAKQLSSLEGSALAATPAELRRCIDRFCDEFEALWRSGEPPKLEACLSKCPAAMREQLLHELLALELDYRLERGEVPTVQDYLNRFGEQRAIVEQAFASHPALGETQLPESTRWPRAPRAAAGASLVGSRLGKYEILAELGRGGMGVVYQARQADLDRIVAVKMLLSGPHAQAHDLEYFRREAEAVARLQHPHIVQVFDVGEHEGQPYFSLEYLPGGSLNKQLAGTPQPPQSAAALIVTLARALHHAHERGVVHRDLKPGNILLTTDGTPKITDFGLAKRLDNQSHTVTGAVLGTPSYMAPEQAAGDSRRIGAAADIYGLGAILYELLTGRPPFKGETPWDTVAQVLTDEPVPPARLQPKVPRDLETICLKCLQKDIGRRYHTAAELADDLDRFRRGEPIEARPVRLAERLSKWARRRPAVAALAVACIAVILIGLVSTTSLWMIAECRRVTADETAKRARQEIRHTLIAAAEDPSFLRDGAQPARNLLLRRTLQYFREFAAQRKDDEELAADVADAYQRAGHALSVLGDSSAALEEFLQAAAIYEQLAKRKLHDRALQNEWAGVLQSTSLMQMKIGEYAAAEESLQHSLDKYESLQRGDFDDPHLHKSLAIVKRQRGMLQYQQGKFAEALETLQAAQQEFERLHTDPFKADVAKDLADCLTGIGHAQWNLSRPRDAIAAYDAARLIREPLVARNPFPHDRAELARIYGSLGQAHSAAGDHTAALQSFQQGLQLREELVRTNPYVIDYQYDLALSCKQVADVLEGNSQFAPALPLRQRSVTLFAEVLRLDPPNVNYANAQATAHAALAFTFRKGFQKPAEAETELHRALGLWQSLIRRKVASPAHQFTFAQAQADLAYLHLHVDDWETAVGILETSSATLAGLLKSQPDHADYLSQLSVNTNNAAYCLQMLGRWDDGLRKSAEAVLIREQLAKNVPQVKEHAAKLEKSRADLTASVTIYTERQLPIAKDAEPAEQLAGLRKRLERWEQWCTEFPSIKLFHQRRQECKDAILKLQAAM